MYVCRNGGDNDGLCIGRTGGDVSLRGRTGDGEAFN